MGQIIDALKKAIADSGLSHYAISQKANVSEAVISRFVSGKRAGLTVETAERLAGALGMKLRAEAAAKRKK